MHFKKWGPVWREHVAILADVIATNCNGTRQGRSVRCDVTCTFPLHQVSKGIAGAGLPLAYPALWRNTCRQAVESHRLVPASCEKVEHRHFAGTT